MRLLTPLEKGIKRMETVLFDIRRQVTRDLEKEQKEERKKAKQLARLKEKQDALMPEKLEIAQKIMTWAQEFSQSDPFKELLALGFSNEDGLLIRIGPQAHRLDQKKNRGLWARTYVGQNGTLFYWTGYKWMARLEGAKEISSAQALAELFTHKSLESLCQYIDTGEVYRYIEEECYRNVDCAKDHVRERQEVEE